LSPVRDEVVDKRCWRDHVIWGDYPDWDDVLGNDNDGRTCHSHKRIEVARGKCVREIAEMVG
jgi:hypothetical protein